MLESAPQWPIKKPNIPIIPANSIPLTMKAQPTVATTNRNRG